MALDSAYVDGKEGRGAALKWFENARERMTALSVPERVQADLAANIAILEGGAELAWAVDDGPEVHDLRLPRLK